MRVVKVTWNQKLNPDANYSLQAEVVLDDDADLVAAGREVFALLEDIQQGMRDEADARA